MFISFNLEKSVGPIFYNDTCDRLHCIHVNCDQVGVTSIKYKVERDERNLPYIELGHWLCSRFQLETPLNFYKPTTRKLYNVE